MKPICPICQSSDVTFLSKKQCYICEDCNHEFVPEVQFEPLRIFISYGHDEYAAFAQKLSSDLKDRGHEVWFDIDRLKPGADWEKYVEEGLDWVSALPGKGRMILIMTPHSVRRPDGYCLNEISRALDSRLFIIPVMLVWCRPPLTISRIQWLDMQHCSSLPVPEGRYTISKNRLIEALENERIDFEGQVSLLNKYLEPLKFEADIIHYQKWFTGRKWVFEKIENWLQDEKSPRLFWITGLPGIGKTAIATQLRERLPNMAAFHLCRKGISEKSSPRRAVMSIAHQLSTQLPDYAERLASVNFNHLLSNPDVNASSLFDALIVQPLARDIQRPELTQVILIDGLDEATQDGRNVLAEFIASEFVKLPEWLRLIITSRPDPEVIHPLQAWDRWTLETEAPENKKDLEEYIIKMLKDTSNISIGDNVIKTIIKNSEGIFLYAEWVCYEIQNGRLSSESPDQFPKGLGGIYASFFRDKLISDKSRQDDVETYQKKFRPVLEFILAAREPLQIQQISKWMQWNKYDEESFFKKFGSLFFLDSEGCMRPFHTSVLDWIGDHDKAGDFYVDIHAGNKRLTELLWEEYQRKGALAISNYGLKHLPVHLIGEKSWDNLVDLLCDLDYIQAKAAAKLTYDLVNDFNAALEVIPDNAENVRQEKERQTRLDKYAKDLILYAKGEINKLEIPESITPWSEEKINAEIERIKKNPNRADRLTDFKNFLGQEAYNLHTYANEFAHFATQQAWNYATEGPVGKAAEEGTPDIYKSLLLQSQPTRPPWISHPLALQTLKGHTSGVWAVSITPDGKMAITGSSDNTCIVWDLIRGASLRTLKGHTDGVLAVSITPDGKMAISGSSDNTCIVWDLIRGDVLQILKGHTDGVLAVSITPDGKMAISGSSDNTCIVWDLSRGWALQTLKGHADWVSAVSITPEGRIAISGSFDNTCIVWDLSRGEALQTLKGHTNGILAVSITPDRKWAITGSSDNTCIVWDLESGAELQSLKGHIDYVMTVSLTPDGKRAITGSSDNTCIVWDLISGTALQTLKGHTDWVSAVSITPDGKMSISTSKDNTCILWNLVSGAVFQTFKGHNDWVSAVSITPDGKMAISGSKDHTCLVWDLISGASLCNLKGHTDWVSAVSITPDGKRAISGSKDKTCIVWDLITGVGIQTLKGHAAGVWAVSITPDGKRAISGSSDNICIIWDMINGMALKTLNGHNSGVWAVSITPDGKRAISGSKDNTCIVWDLITGKVLRTLKGHTSGVWAVSITPDGKKAISGSSDNTCIIWDLISGVALRTLKGHTSGICTVAITSDGKKAISGSIDNTCILWDIENDKYLARLVKRSAIFATAIFPNGILIGCSSGEVMILNLESELLCSSIAISSIRQIWDFELNQYLPLSADCPLCGHRFSTPAEVLDTIKEITNRYGLKPHQSPCLELPDEAWEHPGLLSECPKCKEKLKFNPFIAGGDD